MRRVEKQNIRVVVDISDPWLLLDKSPEALERARLAIAERVKKDILRHIDDIEGVAVIADTVTVCDVNGWPEGDGNLLDRWPECCDEDQVEFFRQHRSESDEWFAAAGMGDPDWLAELREEWAT